MYCKDYTSYFPMKIMAIYLNIGERRIPRYPKTLGRQVFTNTDNKVPLLEGDMQIPGKKWIPLTYSTSTWLAEPHIISFLVLKQIIRIDIFVS